MSKKYHSALKDELELNNRLKYYESNGSVVFQHDITEGKYELYQKADVIYSEPAWKDGYDKFINRAGFENEEGYEGFKKYLYHIKKTISELNIPTYIIMGKHMLKYLDPDRTEKVNLHGYGCLVGLYNNAKLDNIKNNEDVLQYVVENYNNILDFSCGYGNVAREASKQNKKFICSDINSKCIYYVASNFMGYEEG